MTAEGAKAGRGDFFAIDAAIWPKVVALGLNEMVAFLVLARGSGGDHASTSWSVNAIETYTGISRPAARSAIKNLEAASLLAVVKAGTRPRYVLQSSPAKGEAPERIWLPNSLIDGAGDEVAPVELIRQTQNHHALDLFIRLYGVHDLPAYGGVWWQIIRLKFSRTQVAEKNSCVVWAFQHDGEVCWPKQSIFKGLPKDLWSTLTVLRTLGLYEYVAHLIEADTDSAAVVHPFGWGNGETAERRLAVATHKHAALLAGVDANGTSLGGLVAVKKHLTEVAMVGVLRLKYRPHTAQTAEWLAKMAEYDALAVVKNEQAEAWAEYEFSQKSA